MQNRKLKILLILPEGHIHTVRFGKFIKSMREAPLTMPVLASLTPNDIDVDYRYVDESINHVPYEFEADLVAISAITGTAGRAYELAGYFRKKGITVVLGGVHVSLMPEEAALHADSIVVGPAEKSWPQLLKDFINGKLQKEYQYDVSCESEILHMPTPRYDLMRRNGYAVADTVMATRGCRQACDFCSIPAQKLNYTKRPVEDVIRDIQSTLGKLIVFNDVSLVDDVDYAEELFTNLIPYKKKWGGLATTKLLYHPKLVELMARSGCKYLLIGFESFRADALAEIHKGFNQEKRYDQLISLLHENDISIQGTFIFGFDSDEFSVFEQTVQKINDLRIDIPRFSILTPYPGTRLFDRLAKEKRIITYDWRNYDTMHVVFEPANMSPENLYNGFKMVHRETFSIKQILTRHAGIRFRSIINLAGNLTYRRFSRQLEKNTRYAQHILNGSIENRGKDL